MSEADAETANIDLRHERTVDDDMDCIRSFLDQFECADCNSRTIVFREGEQLVAHTWHDTTCPARTDPGRIVGR